MATTVQSTFSSSGEDAISRSIDVTSHSSAQRPESSGIADFYEIERTAKQIKDGAFKRIALQFPDELLHDSVPVYRLLKQRVNDDQELYVLADTSYGSCCVDEVAAQHVDADLMVHYGHACLSQTSRLPVIYVFGEKPIDVTSCVNQLAHLVVSKDPPRPSFVVIRHDVAYSYQAGEIVNQLRDKVALTGTQILYDEIAMRTDPLPSQPKSDDTDSRDVSVHESTNIKSPNSGEDHSIVFYIGEESLALTNILMTSSSHEVYSYSPITNELRLESGRTNKLLMRRFVAVQKARDADVFGILVGTLGVASYLSVITYLRQLIGRSQKKSYTISVGKLNPAKLANFMEIECFVLAACPENSIIESKEFFKPIVTPYELKVALQPEGTWLGRYVLDFAQLIAGDGYAAADTANDTEESSGVENEDPDKPSFSLVTGKYRQARRFGVGGEQTCVDDSGGTTALALRNQESSLTKLSDNAAAIFLQSRTYRGLEARVGEDTPSALEQGRSGIARGYADDHPVTNV